MIKSSHLLIGASAVAAIYFGGSYLLKLGRLSSEMESDTRVSIHNVSLSGIELSINVKLKNPSGGSIQKDKDGQPKKVIKDWTKRNDHRHHVMDAFLA